ncbi:glucuronate isomerase [Vibrio fluvialis]|nr:glucuronate isomerase [Vibrio fluvialis]
MNSSYIHDNFLLTNPLAEKLYHHVAKSIPIIDFHNHLDAKLLYEDCKVKNLFECWLKHDHYYWRAMRSNGIEERFITGEVSDYEKFIKWCETMPYLVGNPLHHWSHLELRRFFNIDEIVSEKSVQDIWLKSLQYIEENSLSYRQIIEQVDAKVLCTTNAPLEDLKYHALLAQEYASEKINAKVLPTFRADELFDFNNIQSFCLMLSNLSKMQNSVITNLSEYIALVKGRMVYFDSHGCRLADLGLTEVDFELPSKHEAENIFVQVLTGHELDGTQTRKLKSYFFVEFGKLCHQQGWTLQLHIGVTPNINARRKTEVGAGTGFSAMSDLPKIKNLGLLLSELDFTHQLPKMVLFNLNPNDNSALIALCGAFQDSDSAGGKVQFGPAWWFNDHKQGIEQQLTTLKNLGLLGRFIGMTTDSRNMLSLSRHEYFRRIFCNQLSTWVLQGDIPDDWELLKFTVQNVCYHNAQQFFEF